MSGLKPIEYDLITSNTGMQGECDIVLRQAVWAAGSN